jgi:hypothetical protein
MLTMVVILFAMAFEIPTAVQLRVTLAEIEPSIWRRLIVPRSFHLGQLHHVIQAAFGWWDYHLHEFQIGGLSFGNVELSSEREFEGDPHTLDERQIQLLDFSRMDPIRFAYVYDFGDHWVHLVEFERLLVLEPAPRSASCIDGARARPPEDVGGAGGYQNFLEIMADLSHPEHRDTKRWAGGQFDSEWVDREICDRDVRSALRANRRIRMHQPRPRTK